LSSNFEFIASLPSIKKLEVHGPQAENHYNGSVRGSIRLIIRHKSSKFYDPPKNQRNVTIEIGYVCAIGSICYDQTNRIHWRCMTSAVAGILQAIEALSLSEQQELVVALCDRITIDEPLAWTLGADPDFADLDCAGKRELLRQKLLSGLEQIQQGRVVDGEVVFARLQAKLRRMNEPQA
jgi:hypothetical protein